MYGKAIKTLMKQNLIDTTYELSEEIGMARTPLQAIIDDKTTKPHRATIKKLAKFFGLSVIELKMLAKKEIEQGEGNV